MCVCVCTCVQVPIKQREALSYVSTIEESMVKAFPFTVPSEYDNLPQLLVHGASKGAMYCVIYRCRLGGWLDGWKLQFRSHMAARRFVS